MPHAHLSLSYCVKKKKKMRFLSFLIKVCLQLLEQYDLKVGTFILDSRTRVLGSGPIRLQNNTNIYYSGNRWSGI